MQQLSSASPPAFECEEAIRSWRRKANTHTVRTPDDLLNLVEATEMEEAPQPPGLAVTLRPYQLQSLGFMQRAETWGGSLHQGVWFQLSSGDGRHFWWSPVLQEARIEEPPLKACGGFLCETMGLGKTVEVLALILGERLPPVATRVSTLFPEGHPERSRCGDVEVGYSSPSLCPRQP